MLFIFAFALILSVSAFSEESFARTHKFLAVGQFAAPTAADSRGPCPGWNVLANHGFINRNGRNISYVSFRTAVNQVFGIPNAVTDLAAVNAHIQAQIFPGGVLASMDSLSNTHNIIEHDASLTRDDQRLGDAINVSPALVNAFLPDLNAVLKRDDIAKFRMRRILDSKSRNPDFTWKLTSQQPVAAGESAFLHTILGRGNGTMPARWLYEFLKNERLPGGYGSRQISTLEFTGITAYYLAREVVSRDSSISETDAMAFAEATVRKQYEGHI